MDSVEILMAWEESFGITIADAEAEILTTPQEAIELICRKLGATESSRNPCLSMRAFNRLRRGILANGNLSRKAVRLKTKLKDLEEYGLHGKWDAVCASAQITTMPKPRWLSLPTVEQFIKSQVLLKAKDLKRTGESWTPAEVREIVRAIVSEVTGARAFRDSDRFIEDIGID